MPPLVSLRLDLNSILGVLPKDFIDGSGSFLLQFGVLVQLEEALLALGLDPRVGMPLRTVALQQLLLRFDEGGGMNMQVWQVFSAHGLIEKLALCEVQLLQIHHL